MLEDSNDKNIDLGKRIDALEKNTLNNYIPITGNQTSDRVTVVNAQGQRGTIPSSQLQDAIKQGYKQVQ